MLLCEHDYRKEIENEYVTDNLTYVSFVIFTHGAENAQGRASQYDIKLDHVMLVWMGNTGEVPIWCEFRLAKRLRGGNDVLQTLWQ